AVFRGSSIPGEIHPLLPLHLVAACNECDRPRCSCSRSCWRWRRRHSCCRRRRTGLGAVPPACVKEIQPTRGATPGDHLTARPYCCVGGAGGGCVGCACGCPTIGAG